LFESNAFQFSITFQANKLGIGIHMHVAEIQDEVEYCRKNRGNTTVSHLHKIGFLGSNLLAIHCVWLEDEELKLFAENEVNVSHCPASAMRFVVIYRVLWSSDT
jgi:5-methylthioadenosine/S-adenosylhomocysteine deaminase